MPVTPPPSPLESSKLTPLVLVLVFVSGLSGLIYQLVWTRELRLIFGASTAASSAVVAIFVAGLGFGGLWLGARIEHSARPLRVYALLELSVGVLSALTPWLLALVRALYVKSGGAISLGMGGSNVLRLLLAALVLLPPTFAMGGTLPAIARVLERDDTGSRRSVALAYALNTLGAVAGAALTTFVLLESLGNKRSLYLACGLNVLVGALAWLAAAFGGKEARAPEPVARAAASEPVAPAWFVYASAAVVGFAFFLLELLFYRVLGPLLGGSVFSFGVILCVALAGIGAGSAAYAVFGRARPQLAQGFALSCAAEALCVIGAYALGDRLALAALFLQPFAAIGFRGLVLGWFAVALCAVFPAAFVSGWQFPQLIALLGAGRQHVARDVGSAYAANTLGALAGALAGGFGLVPALGALGCWRAVSILLAAWSLVALGVAYTVRPRSSGRPSWAASSGVVLLTAATLTLLRADGPSAVLRHSPIGVGRVPIQQLDSPNAVESYLTQERRTVDWETDGIESAVAVTHYDGIAFIVNGKSDGSALADAPTQVMGGLVGAALLPRVRNALVIGLGTGSTAGWLASLPEIERVDVVEIEPAILQVAKRCRVVNRDALNNPKLHVLRGDARELLAVLQGQYDVIFSEPSNPYRAGVASLYSEEFYREARQRLSPEGVFVQWLQLYDTEASSVRTIYATVASSFDHVESWSGLREDLLLVASQHSLVHDPAALRTRLAAEPFASALRLAWFTSGLEGFLSHYVANEDFAKLTARGEVQHNTDDLSPVEFGFARSARGGARYSASSLFGAVDGIGAHRPKLTAADVDWARVDFERESFTLALNGPTNSGILPIEYQSRLAALGKWANGDTAGAMTMWTLMPVAIDKLTPIERLARAEVMAYQGSIESERSIEQLLYDRPTEAEVLHAVYLLQHGRRRAGSELVRSALQRYRSDPWPYPVPIARLLSTLVVQSPADAELVPLWLDALSHPFALYVNETARQSARLRLTQTLGAGHPGCVQLFESFEPNPPWVEDMLQFRANCYEAHSHALRDRAARDIASYRDNEPADFLRLLALP